MRDPKRIDRILAKVRAHWHTYPDLRLTQLICNACPTRGDPFYVEDDVLERGLDQWVED